MRTSIAFLLLAAVALGCGKTSPPPKQTGNDNGSPTAKTADPADEKVSPAPAEDKEFKTIKVVEKPAGVTFKTLEISLSDDDLNPVPFTIEVPEDVEFTKKFYSWTGELTGKDFSVKIDDSKPEDEGIAAQHKYLKDLPGSLEMPTIVLETDRAIYFELYMAMKLYLQIFAVEVPIEGRTLIARRNTLPTEEVPREAMLAMVYSASTLKPKPKPKP